MSEAVEKGEIQGAASDRLIADRPFNERIDLLDPLDPDGVEDEVVLTTRRAIGRVALVAAETAGRFEREAIRFDPMSWMWAPRAVFGGASAIDACLSRDDCLRGIMVHGLGLELDVERPVVDALLASDDDDPLDPLDFSDRYAPRPSAAGGRRRQVRVSLYTAVIADGYRNQMIQAFHASFATGRDEIVERLAKRFDRSIAERADIRMGFHPAMPLVVALVPDAVAEVIHRVERSGASTAVGNFAIDISQVIRA